MIWFALFLLFVSICILGSIAIYRDRLHISQLDLLAYDPRNLAARDVLRRKFVQADRLCIASFWLTMILMAGIVVIRFLE